ncbi:MAG: hypothetical protein K5790_10290 [Nitrosopumilus sp.]|uniref:hypothetical protein n=1 Tax=Nitrosopumilus sp. TaxID=2024843 RepID=UPI00247D08E9|nr:hypothetical protein [Nitrosopumilus sp.]MCV0393658.1 hypothetical protein [Nitrosopumilus sp.]
MVLVMPNAEMTFENWEARIKFQMEEEGGFEYDDEHNANDWSKCAVGERDKELRNILRSGLNLKWATRKLSPEVIKLGQQFESAIYDNKKEEALKIYHKIKSIPEEKFYLKSEDEC